MKQIIIACFLIFISFSSFGQVTAKHEDFVNKGLAYLKDRKFLEGFSQTDTVFISLKGIDESRHNYYFIEGKLQATNSLTRCDDINGRNGCLYFYFGLLNKSIIECRLINYGRIEGKFIVKEKAGKYKIENFSYMSVSH